MSFHYKKRRGEDHGIDDWLMTYADMITLILCFFAIFLSISIPKKDAFQQARAKVMEKFATIPLSVGEADITEDIPRGVPTDKARLSGLPSIVGDLNDNDDNPPSQKYNKQYDEDRSGDRLTSMEMNSSSSFALGSATLSDEGKKALDEALVMVQSDKYKDYTITIEGHTDDSPISTLQFPSNWELSTARAAAVARYFIEHGVAVKRLRASGYADAFPKVPNRKADGTPIPENQAQNRRVVIKLEKVEKQGNR